MPLYEYQCDACGRRFEVIQKFSDPAPEACTQCGKGPVRRLLSSPAIQFKGSGWYITDYAKKGKNDSSTNKSKGESKTEATDKAAEKSDASPKSESASKSDATPSSTPAANKD